MLPILTIQELFDLIARCDANDEITPASCGYRNFLLDTGNGVRFHCILEETLKLLTASGKFEIYANTLRDFDALVDTIRGFAVPWVDEIELATQDALTEQCVMTEGELLEPVYGAEDVERDTIVTELAAARNEAQACLNELKDRADTVRSVHEIGMATLEETNKYVVDDTVITKFNRELENQFFDEWRAIPSNFTNEVVFMQGGTQHNTLRAVKIEFTDHRSLRVVESFGLENQRAIAGDADPVIEGILEIVKELCPHFTGNDLAHFECVDGISLHTTGVPDDYEGVLVDSQFYKLTVGDDDKELARFMVSGNGTLTPISGVLFDATFIWIDTICDFLEFKDSGLKIDLQHIAKMMNE